MKKNNYFPKQGFSQRGPNREISLRVMHALSHRVMWKILWEFGPLDCLLEHLSMVLYCPKGPWGERYEPAKSASQPYLHCLSKMPTKERESSFIGWNRSWWIHIVFLYLLDTSLSKFERKTKSPWWSRGWGNLSKCHKTSLKDHFQILAIDCVCFNRFILWYGLVHCWNGYLSMLLVFLMGIR